MENDTTAVTTALTPEQKKMVNAIRGTTPVVLLPRGGMGKRPDTVEDVIEMLQNMSTSATFWINKHQEAADELAETKQLIRSGRKLVRLMMDDEDQ